MSGEFGKALDRQIKTKMPRPELESHLSARLKEVRMCTLVTSSGEKGRGTPLEYFSDGLTIYIGPDPGTKTKNLAVNPNVSISIFNDLNPDWEKDWASIWAIQITGQGKLYDAGTPEQARAREVIDFESYFRALGKNYTKVPPERRILKVVPAKIELTDFALIDRGFSYRQVWLPAT